ncbi:YhcN/YlaJ family sporulation lipoprotein [Paenibacillus sp. IB182496]|uniref:YhcN/YlaJ family sporulation lipoprotein n=1 Tax=Paenibacillus sabuli TaxID=2772509 RepID=A0A927GS74_9BACL|nr:YhcN/YlaJ family sporulation lipoprotein [Paenibacillus sabuli]MBD2846434.1 YhcN/YlaJ family sporulation lipoprotein [Paenibacillus sabuli]
MKKQKLVLLCLLATLLSVGALGCAAETQGGEGNKNITNNSVKKDANGNTVIDKRFADDKRNEMNRIDGRPQNGNNVVGTHENYRIDMDEKVADQIAAMPDVDGAYVMMGDRNAYVAVMMKEKTGGMKSMSKSDTSASEDQLAMNDRLKSRIAGQVKKLKPSIENVYVSANPEFVDRMTGYMDEARAGHPVQGLLTEFNAMAERIFPQNFER